MLFDHLLKFRYLAVVMVIIALLDAIAYLVLGIRIAFHAYAHLLDGVSSTSAENRPGLELLHSLDFVFVSLVLIVLGLGIAKLFLLPPSSKAYIELPVWLRIERISELKVLLWETILTHPAHCRLVAAGGRSLQPARLDDPAHAGRDPDPGVESVLHEKGVTPKGVTTVETSHFSRGGGAAFLSDAASPAQLRIDLWNRLREQLARAAERPLAEHPAEIDQLLDRLDELERLWAYPGVVRVARLRHLHHSGDRVQLRALADEMVDRLSAEGDRAALVGEVLERPDDRARTRLLHRTAGRRRRVRSAALPPELPARSARPRERRSDLRHRARPIVRGGLAGGRLQRRHPGGGDAAPVPDPSRPSDHCARHPRRARSPDRTARGARRRRSAKTSPARFATCGRSWTCTCSPNESLADAVVRTPPSCSGASSIASRRRTSCT